MITIHGHFLSSFSYL